MHTFGNLHLFASFWIFLNLHLLYLKGKIVSQEIFVSDNSGTKKKKRRFENPTFHSRNFVTKLRNIETDFLRLLIWLWPHRTEFTASQIPLKLTESSQKMF